MVVVLFYFVNNFLLIFLYDKDDNIFVLDNIWVWMKIKDILIYIGEYLCMFWSNGLDFVEG